MIAIDGCYVATVDAAGTEHPRGYVVLDGDRIAAVGSGPLPSAYAAAERVDGSGLLATPGLVNTHHHLYQWITRGYAADDTLFGWLTTLYPVWAGLDAELVSRVGRGEPGLAGADRLQHHAPTTTTCSRPDAATCSRPRSWPPGRSGCAFTRAAGR